jgi:hypothetical protein
MKKAGILVFSIMFLIGLATFIIADNNSEDLSNSQNNTVCTQEAKLCSDGSYVSRNSNHDCDFDECPELNETILGADCGTVTPGSQNECCENKGYDKWNTEEFACIKELENDDDNETEVEEEDECEPWNCTKWDTCVNGTQKRDCKRIFSCTIYNNDDNETQAKPRTSKECLEKERIRNRYNNSYDCPENCTCAGSTIKCEFEGGRTMTVYAGNSGNMIVQIKGINSSTNVTLYKGENGKVYGTFQGNETHEIILPDEIMDKLKERHQKRLQLYNESINLTEDGYYQIQTKKKARLFWLVPVKEQMGAEVDAETGEIVDIRNPWWGFLARDIRE